MRRLRPPPAGGPAPERLYQDDGRVSLDAPPWPPGNPWPQRYPQTGPPRPRHPFAPEPPPAHQDPNAYWPRSDPERSQWQRGSHRRVNPGSPANQPPAPQRESSTDLADRQPQEEAAVRRIALALDKYGLDLRDLSSQQLRSLSTAILRLLRTDSPAQSEMDITTEKKASMMEGAMRHWKETEADVLRSPVPGIPSASPSAALPAQRDLPGDVPKPGPASDVPRGLPKARREQGAVAGAEGTVQAGMTQEARSRVVAEIAEMPGIPAFPATLRKLESAAGAEVLPKEEYGYIVTDKKPLALSDGVKLLETLAHRIHLTTASFINISVIGPALTFRVRLNGQNLTIAEVASRAIAEKSYLEAETGLKILQAGVGERNELRSLPSPTRHSETFRFLLLSLVTVACVAGVLIAGTLTYCLRQNYRQRQREKLSGLGTEPGTNTTLEYQELCRQHMAGKSSYGAGEAVETSRVSSVSSQFSDAPQASPSSHSSSTPSWCEEPVQSNMDISTGHMILAYMEDHLRQSDRLQMEWEALSRYQAEPNTCAIGKSEVNLKKSRNADFVPYDHNRMMLKAQLNPSRTDFINASPIIDHEPRMPAYIATQGPLSHTIADFWQMVWENGCTVIVMLTPLVEDGVKHCDAAAAGG
ncbi:receptor-type tyrosine-protein phosphatase-like N, partial [Callorhinchus milii]|uniref:receptor-type tyrosine-protein phosphatase-like N n=1 Tax=Callorhinchus milii TaxID=7868 RepID=UPI001C3FC2EF